MGGHLNELFIEGSGGGEEFPILPPYDHVVDVYDSLDRITSAIYYDDVAETTIMQQFTITYSADGHPIVDGVEYKNHILDVYSGKLVINTSSTAALLQDNSGVVTRVIKGIAESVSFSRYNILSNTPDHSLIWPTIAETISCVSTSALDTLAGVGIRTLTINGVDNTGLAINETVNLSGVTPVITTSTFKRINSIISTASGANEVAMGRISFTNTSSIQLIDTISPGDTRSVSFKYTVPLNKRILNPKVRLSCDNLGEYDVRIIVWDRASTLPPYRFHHVFVTNISNELYNFPNDDTTNWGAETDIAAVIIKKSGREFSFFSGEMTVTELSLV